MIESVRFVTLDNQKSYYIKDHSMFLVKKSVTRAVPRTNYVEVPGRNGSIDMTEVLGAVTYNDREMSIVIRTLAKQDDRDNVLQSLVDFIHGQRVKCYIGDFCYTGRFTVGETSINSIAMDITVTATVNPYLDFVQTRYFNNKELSIYIPKNLEGFTMKVNSTDLTGDARVYINDESATATFDLQNGTFDLSEMVVDLDDYKGDYVNVKVYKYNGALVQLANINGFCTTWGRCL